ncbi:MAG: hypothetical protein H6948_18030 [Zoogloeaceae bacterium]|nr:hypothetical protein [Rhodocyclaceae bacterium]MCP5233941.1 hypothetical protein [Zoogloeaceae bacterium]MCP5253334.1 hypothetical protein [Zoogloeaceae bacterium]MCW5617240.1 hypothetical protein [Rhodocyclaceae bacterium]
MARAWPPGLRPRAMLNLRFFRAHWMSSDVIFIHKQPPLRNIGDELCSPRHYFDLRSARERLAVVGGGVFADFGERDLARRGLTAQDAVLWGVGRSLKRGSDSLERIATLPHLAWGLRDIDGVADPERFLPCVSCLHPMLDAGAGQDGTLLFVNAEPRVTPADGETALRALAAARGWQFLQNDCSDQAMRDALRGNRRVITNSFHGAYWSLLSGHDTFVTGYSSKFVSLFRAFGLDPQPIVRYEKPRKLGFCGRLRGRAGAGLLNGVVQAVDENRVVRLADSRAMLAAFRERNLAFAQALVAEGVLKAYSLRA